MKKDLTLFFNFGGNKNFGDDLILKLWSDRIYSENCENRVIFNSYSSWALPILNKNFIINSYMNGLARDKMLENSSNADSIEVDEAIVGGEAAADYMLTHDVEWRKILGAVRCCHISGGGYLNNLFVESFAIASMMAKLSNYLSVPVYGTGLGLMPNAERSEIVKRFFSRFSKLEVRDADSYSYARQFVDERVLFLGSDDSFIEEIAIFPEPTRPKRLYVNIQSDMLVDHLHDYLMSDIEDFMRAEGQEFELAYLLFFDNADSIFCRRLKALFPQMRVFSRQQLLIYGVPFREGDRCITSRFHCHLLASRSGVRGVYVAPYAQYYDIKHGSVVQTGSKWKKYTNGMLREFLNDSNQGPNIDNQTIMSRKSKLIHEIYGSYQHG